jgi:NADPH:quinone reductase-like Zn-dependent oxidoreductase
VLGHACGITSKQTREGGFQSHTILQEVQASTIPLSLPYEEAAVVALGFSTAACGLLQEQPFLHLDYPTEPARKPNGQVVLVLGGASSVGSNAIQLARAAGYEACATA